MRIEEQHPDVLQNIEFAVVTFYRRHPEMSDYSVMRTYEALINSYSAEALGRTPKPLDISALETELLASTQTMCEWRLGRGSAATPGEAMDPPTKIDSDTLLLCLKRLLKSTKKWNKHGGHQGYLQFISQYVR